MRSRSLETKKKAKKRRKCRKGSRRYFSSDYSTSSSSGEGSGEHGGSQDEKQAKIERFHVVSQEHINKYDLADDLAEMHINNAKSLYLRRKLKSLFCLNMQFPRTYRGLTDWTAFCEILSKIKAKSC